MAGPKGAASSSQQKGKAGSSVPAIQAAVDSLWKSYNDTTSPRLKLIDAFLVFIMLTGIAQFLYCILVTNYPFNAFLAGCVYMVSAA